MCAVFLQREGGAKRTSWRGGPSSVMTADEGGQSEVGGGPSAVFPSGTCPTAGEVSMARGVDGAAQEKTGSEYVNCPTSDPCAKESHANGQDLRRLIPRPITKMNLRLTFTFA